MEVALSKPQPSSAKAVMPVRKTHPQKGDKRHGRSRVSNGTRLLDGIDGRSASARRFKDLIAGLARDEFGGAENLSIAELSLLRQAAALMLSAEQMQAAVVRGEAMHADELVRVSSESRRVLDAMRRSTRAVPREPQPETLKDYLATTTIPARKGAPARLLRALRGVPGRQAGEANDHPDGCIGR